jgi:hypothetical protein
LLIGDFRLLIETRSQSRDKSAIINRKSGHLGKVSSRRTQSRKKSATINRQSAIPQVFDCD